MNSLYFRFLALIPLTVLFAKSPCQSIDSISHQIEKIQKEKIDLLQRVDSLNDLIEYLQVQRNNALQKKSTEGFYGTTTNDKDVWDTSYQYKADKLFNIPTGTRLRILEQENLMYRIYSDEENRYVYTGFIRFDDENAKEILQTNWNNRKSEIEEKIRNQRETEKAEEQRLAEIERKKKEAEIRQAEEQRRKNIYNKYSENIANKIIDREIWIGMTKQMAIDSWGNPGKINRTVTENLVREQWVYERNYKTYYLYFRNGKLDAFQEN